MTVIKRKRKLKDGKQIVSYQAQICFGGSIVERKTFPTASAAHRYHDTRLKMYQGGLVGKEVYTFEKCLQDYLKEEFSRLRLSTQQAKESRVRYLTNSPLSSISMSQFDDRSIDHWFEWLEKQETAKNKRRKTFIHELKFLSVVLNWYRETKNASFVIPILRRHRKKCDYKPVQARVPDYYMKPEEVKSWLEHLRTKRPDPVYYQLGLFMVLTGCRLGEAAGLHWDAVFLDCDRPHVRIVRTLSWDHYTKEAYVQNDVKTSESRRMINLAPTLVARLKEMKRSRLPAGPVFLTNKGRFLRDNTVRLNFDKAFQACGLQWSGTHIARHTFATQSLIANGGDLSTVQAVLGHSNVKQTQQYAKVVALQDNDSAIKTAELLGLTGFTPSDQNCVENCVPGTSRSIKI